MAACCPAPQALSAALPVALLLRNGVDRGVGDSRRLCSNRIVGWQAQEAGRQHESLGHAASRSDPLEWAPTHCCRSANTAHAFRKRPANWKSGQVGAGFAVGPGVLQSGMPCCQCSGARYCWRRRDPQCGSQSVALAPPAVGGAAPHHAPSPLLLPLLQCSDMQGCCVITASGAWTVLPAAAWQPPPPRPARRQRRAPQPSAAAPSLAERLAELSGSGVDASLPADAGAALSLPPSPLLAASQHPQLLAAELLLAAAGAYAAAAWPTRPRGWSAKGLLRVRAGPPLPPLLLVFFMQAGEDGACCLLSSFHLPHSCNQLHPCAALPAGRALPGGRHWRVCRGAHRGRHSAGRLPGEAALPGGHGSQGGQRPGGTRLLLQVRKAGGAGEAGPCAVFTLTPSSVGHPALRPHPCCAVHAALRTPRPQDPQRHAPGPHRRRRPPLRRARPGPALAACRLHAGIHKRAAPGRRRVLRHGGGRSGRPQRPAVRGGPGYRRWGGALHGLWVRAWVLCAVLRGRTAFWGLLLLLVMGRYAWHGMPH